MKKIEIYDPAMCCSTGVCGPSVDPELTRVASAVYSLEKKGFDVKRYQLTNNPDMFAKTLTVNNILHEKGPEALPIVLVDEQVVKVGSYPTNEEISEWLGVTSKELTEKPKIRLSLNINKK